jgi:NhaP-type Na+/H+ and K+/H+ antiporter
VTGIRLPYSVGLTCIGIIHGIVLFRGLDCDEQGSYTCINKEGVGTNGHYQETMLKWMDIPGNLILFVFLPQLLDENSAYTNVSSFSMHLLSGVVLAGHGVVIQTWIIGLTAKCLIPNSRTWVESFLFGGIQSATDPIAVIALLKELG